MEATTIASACNKVYRRNFLKPNTIGIIPKRGYRWRDNQSKIAIQWMVWEEHQRRIDIQHAAKDQEVRIAKVKVDGYCEGTNQVFEFEGCYYHGCPHCFAHQRDSPLKEEPSETLNLRYEATTAKKDRLKSLGYDKLNFDDCSHSDEERSLIGTWTVDEVLKAIDKGYEVLEKYEIWAYDTVQFGKDVTGLFTDMMNKFIKIKQESSDWPSNCQTQAEKDRYIDRFLERENITLDFSKIIDNPGLRSLAKLILNSFWGKFGQRENQPKTSIVNQSAEFFRMMSNPTIYVNTVLPVNEDTLILIHTPPYWTQANGEVENMNKSILKRLQICQNNNRNYKVTDIVGEEGAQDNDIINKFKGKRREDGARRAKENDITVGDRVVVQHSVIPHKLTSRFGTTEYVVTERRGNEVTVTGDGKTIKRHITHVKRIPSITGTCVGTAESELAGSSTTKDGSEHQEASNDDHSSKGEAIRVEPLKLKRRDGMWKPVTTSHE
ncbi:hypothetical protein JTB14_023254 [Gonioctena quinquepunctata]|nr:hypothetical protein JTB14_023254 [Gonioctena quinquepunctata]